ncbi:MAG: dihydroorotase [Bacteroidales bacterium]|nr:dihydroorotase [Bacteroidales bacterium]
MNTVIKNVRIVNREEDFIGNIYIKNDLIYKISRTAIDFNEDVTLDGSNLTALPGVIDDQVHFRQPGLTHKADIHSESKAAAAGGVTSFMEMPNTKPQTITNDILEEKHQIAQKDSAVNYSFYLGATNDNIKEITNIDAKHICGLKVFMGSSTGNMLVDNISSLEKIFAEAPCLIATHCEDESTIQANTSLFKEKYGETMPFKYHPAIRSAEACYKSSSLAVELASKYNSKLHVLHLSTEKELSLFEKGRDFTTKRITAEVCVHHLNFNEADYDTYGARIKWNPAVKKESDQLALLDALKNDKIDVIATDHAPHTLEEKSNPYFKCPSGGPLVQHSLPVMLEMVRDGKISIKEVVWKMCHAPANLFQIKNRGYLNEGFFADIVLVDLNAPWTVSKDNILYKCKWSPFEGKTFNSKIKYTIVNGKIVYNDKNDEISVGSGMALEFNR